MEEDLTAVMVRKCLTKSLESASVNPPKALVLMEQGNPQFVIFAEVLPNCMSLKNIVIQANFQINNYL